MVNLFFVTCRRQGKHLYFVAYGVALVFFNTFGI